MRWWSKEEYCKETQPLPSSSTFVLTYWWEHWIHRSTENSDTSGAASRVGDTPPGYNTPMTRRSYPTVKKAHKLCWTYSLPGVTGPVWFSVLISAALSAWPKEQHFQTNSSWLIFEGKQVPCVAIGEDFCYLGKLYHFEINANDFMVPKNSSPINSNHC